MGALTSKPFAFIARSWELKSIKSINLFDGEGVSIKLNTRNNEILRILPTFDNYLNNEWINDKTRFNYDGLSKNRLKYVRIENTGLENMFKKSMVSRTIDLKGKRIEWNTVLMLLSNYFNIKSDRLISIISGETDLSTLLMAKKLSANIGSLDLMFEINKNSKYVNVINNYKSKTLNCLSFEEFNNSVLTNPSRLENVDEKVILADTFILVGTNPRFESPILFAKIVKQLNLNANKKVILFNSHFPVSGNSVVNLGNSLLNFRKFIQGRIKQSYYMGNAKSPLFVIGDIADKFYKASLEELILMLYDKYIVKNVNKKYTNWNPFIFLKNNINSAAFSLLFPSNYNNSVLNKKLLSKCIIDNKKYGVLLLGDFAKPLCIIRDLGLSSRSIKFVVHQKSFLNSAININNSILQLPQLYATEARLSFINQFFKKQKSEISTVTSDKERKGWHIVEILNELWVGNTGYESESALIKETGNWEPLMSDRTIIEDTALVESQKNLNIASGTYNKIQYYNNGAWNRHIKNNIHGFFTSDTVSYNSVPMALAQKRREILDFNNFSYKY